MRASATVSVSPGDAREAREALIRSAPDRGEGGAEPHSRRLTRESGCAESVGRRGELLCGRGGAGVELGVEADRIAACGPTVGSERAESAGRGTGDLLCPLRIVTKQRACEVILRFGAGAAHPSGAEGCGDALEQAFRFVNQPGVPQYFGAVEVTHRGAFTRPCGDHRTRLGHQLERLDEVTAQKRGVAEVVARLGGGGLVVFCHVYLDSLFEVGGARVERTPMHVHEGAVQQAVGAGDSAEPVDCPREHLIGVVQASGTREQHAQLPGEDRPGLGAHSFAIEGVVAQRLGTHGVAGLGEHVGHSAVDSGEQICAGVRRLRGRARQQPLRLGIPLRVRGIAPSLVQLTRTIPHCFRMPCPPGVRKTRPLCAQLYCD